MKSKIDTIYIKKTEERIYQGDILRDYKYPEWVTVEKNKIKIIERTIPYLIVLTQDCDLERDYYNHINNTKGHDKYLISILACPGYPAIDLREGLHLEKLELKMEEFDSKRWMIIQNNQNLRYHFLKRKTKFQIPDLVIDFKHYYTISRDVLYKNVEDYYIGSINELFREALSQRFSNYLSRIGLPIIE